MARPPGPPKGSEMDRPTNRVDAPDPDATPDPRDAFVPPSRRLALEICRATLEAGPILLTGDAGAGKTWLWRRLAAENGRPRRWLGVDSTPSEGPDDFYRLIAREIGLAPTGPSRTTRAEIADFLADRHADGDRRALVVEEAHNLSTPVWEEVRVLANRLGHPDGFASLVLVGQTVLARRFSTWAFASIESRLAARVHLGPIDADEAFDWLSGLRPGRGWSRVEAEAIHRDSGGNPGRMLRRLGVSFGSPDRAISSRPQPLPAPAEAPRPAPAPLTGPARPPLLVEENLIEVGWSPDDSPPGDEDRGPLADGSPATSAGAEEAVHDHYAALQAWREWADNQGRLAPAPDDRALADAIDDGAADDASDGASPPVDRPTVWAEDAEESFAPFSQLFSRMAQSRSRAPE